MKDPLVGGLAALLVGCLLLWATVHMIRTGHVPAGRRRFRKAFTREEWPAKFWFHVFVSALLALAMFGMALSRFFG